MDKWIVGWLMADGRVLAMGALQNTRAGGRETTPYVVAYKRFADLQHSIQ